MRKLTLKDFLTFYTPCLSCKNKINLTWIARKSSLAMTPNVGEFSPTLDGKSLTIDLKTTYYNRFSLMIDIITHTFISSDSSEFAKYAAETECYVQAKCFKCNSQVMTTDLKFDVNKRILKPVSIKGEIWHITDEENIYNIYTNTDKEESEIIVDKINAVTPLSPWRRTIEALPINKFSSREDFLDRIKTYMVFS